MARTSTARNRSVVGNSREAKIMVMISSGFPNDTILAALEKENPSIIADNDPRRSVRGNDLPPFDPIARQRTREAIRSCRKQDADKEEEIDSVLRVQGERQGVRPLSESKLENLHRWRCGNDAMDRIYGTSEFVHLEDHPKKLWYKGDPMILDNDDKMVTTRFDTGQMETVVLKRGDKPVTRRKFSLVPNLRLDRQIRERGFPESFLSIWGGAPGVGKSRLAVSVCKTTTEMERAYAEEKSIDPRPILYYNGEAAESQFAQWAGVVDPELFLSSHEEFVRMEDIVEDIYKYQPRLVIVDSLQMIAEVKKNPSRGAELVMSRFKLLKVDKQAGLPHVVFISQLNKQDDLAGSRYLEHMVDFSAVATVWEARDGMFKFASRKNRGGKTPELAIFQHLPNGLKTITEDIRSTSFLKLIQPTAAVPVPSALSNNNAPTHA